MPCDLPEDKLWSWVDREAPELESHLEGCPECRRRAEKIRADIRLISTDLSEVVPVPRKIGSYAIKGLLGEGGQALVYEAEQEFPRRTIALKVLRGGCFARSRNIRHFLRETQTLARLQHPAIATIHEAGRTDEGLHYFAMELVRGKPLNIHLKENELDLPARLDLFRRICQAVQYAHENGVVHRDLKPANILINEQGDPKILDFGLARLASSDPENTISLTGPGMMAGTPRYMSPEQMRGDQDAVDTPSDVYSLGVILYEILTGQPPHDASSFTPETVVTICEEEPVHPRRLDSSLHGDLETIVLKALAKDPDQRYGSASGLEQDLKNFLDGAPIMARRPSVWYVTGKTLMRHRRKLALILVVMVLGSVWVWRSWQPSYDRDEVRARLLELRTQFFLTNPPNQIFRHRALTASDLYPELPEAIMLKALALSAAEERGTALTYLDDKLREDPDQWVFRALRSEIGVVKNPEVDDSFSAWSRNGVDRSVADSWYLRMFTTEDLPQALAWSHIALTHDPLHKLATESVARLSAMTGDLESSLKATSRLLELGDERLVYWLNFRCTLLCRLGRPEEALGEMDKALAIEGSSIRNRATRGQIHRWLGNYEAAVEDYTRAIELTEGGSPNAWYYYHRGTPQWILGNLDEAAADFRKAYHGLARASYGNVRLILVLREQGKIPESEAALVEARLNVADDEWLEAILDCLAGDLTPAELSAWAPVDDHQKTCEGYYYAGEVYLTKGRVEEARRMFTACVETGATIDRGNFHDRLSEYELALWRLSQLDQESN